MIKKGLTTGLGSITDEEMERHRGSLCEGCIFETANTIESHSQPARPTHDAPMA